MALLLDCDQIENLIFQNDYKLARVYEGHINDKDLANHRCFEKIVADNKESVAARIREIKDLLGGNWTFAFGNGNITQKLSSHTRVQASFVKSLPKPEPGQPQPQPHFDKATLIAEIRQEMKKELEAVKAQEEITEMKEELEQLRTWGGKAALAFDNLVKMYINPEQLMNAMQGTEHTPETNTNVNELENAFIVLINALGEQTIINLANKFKEGKANAIIPMVKNFANN